MGEFVVFDVERAMVFKCIGLLVVTLSLVTSRPVDDTSTSPPIDGDVQRSVQYPCGTFWIDELPVAVQPINDHTDSGVDSVFRKLRAAAAALASRTLDLEYDAKAIQSLIESQTTIAEPQTYGIFTSLLDAGSANPPTYRLFASLQETSTVQDIETVTTATAETSTKTHLVEQMITTLQLTKHLLFILAAHEQEMLTAGNISDNMAASLKGMHEHTCQAIRTNRLTLRKLVDQSHDNYTVNALLSNNFPSVQSSYIAVERAYKIMNDVIEMTTKFNDVFKQMAAVKYELVG